MTWQVFNSFKEAVNEGVHNLETGTLQVALTDTLPDLSADTQLSDISQISNAGGYAPVTVTINSSAQSGGTYTLSHDAVGFTASGAAFDTARYWVLFNDSATNDELIGFADYGISYALPDGETWTLNAGDILTLA